MRGFTLIELLVTMVVIGILAAIGLPIYFNAVNKAEESGVYLLLDSLAAPIEEYHALYNKYPDDVNSGESPTISEWPTEIPFNSVLDYEHWGIQGSRCVVLVSHFGRNKVRDNPTHARAGTVGSIVRVGDDWVKTIAEYPCDRPVGGIR